jgi:hypothetical protein
MYTAISIKVVQEESEKVEYERERLVGTALTFPLFSWTTLIEIALYTSNQERL